MSDNIENICPQCGLPNQRASSLEKENYQLAFELKECEEQLQKLKELFIYTYDALAFPLAEFELGKESNEMYELLNQSK